MALFRNKKVSEERPTPPTPPTFQQPVFWPIANMDQPTRWITTDNVLGLPAAWRALNLISNSVATMSPMKCFNGENELDSPLLLSKPTPDMDTFDFFHMVTSSLLLEGNYVAIPLSRDDQGVPEQILTVPNHSVNVRYNDAGRVVYEIADMTLSQDSVLHIRGYSRPGSPWGVGVVEAFRGSMSHQLDRQNAATGAMTGIPSGIVKIHTKEITAEQANLTKDQWLAAFSAGTRAPAVLPDSMDFMPISFSAQDAQWIESAQLGVAEVAFMFGLDPSDLGATVGGSNLTYANITDRAVDRVTNSYGPWMRRIEEGFSALLPGDQVAKLQVEKLLRTTPEGRAAFLTAMISNGVYSLEYAQHLEGVPLEYRTKEEEVAPVPEEMPPTMEEEAA